MKQPTGKTLEEMARDATVIGRAHVDKVAAVNGIRVARVRIVEAFKGCQAGQHLTYLAEPVWRCDISKAVQGETTLLMLTAAPKNPFYLEGWEEKRKQFEKARQGALRGEPLWMLFHSGNGRMPIKMQAGREWVKQPLYVAFPESLHLRHVTVNEHLGKQDFQVVETYALLSEMQKWMHRYRAR